LLERIDEAVQKDIKARQQLLEKASIQDCFNRLTTREKEVLQLIVNSHSNKEAAKILDVSPRTIDAHRARVMEKNAGGQCSGIGHHGDELRTIEQRVCTGGNSIAIRQALAENHLKRH